MAVDKQKAITLRLQGKNYEEIAKELSCSVAWCKANLKGCKQPNQDKPIIAEIRRKGKTPDGITWGEINILIKQVYPNLNKKDFAAKSKALRKAAREGCDDVIIRPYWMLPNSAQDCTNTIMDMAQDVYEIIQSHAKKYRKLYNLDASYQNSIVRDLSMLSASQSSGLLPMGLLVQGERYTAMIEALESRNNASIDGNILSRPLYKGIAEYNNIDAVECGYSTGYEYEESLQPITMDDLEIPY